MSSAQLQIRLLKNEALVAVVEQGARMHSVSVRARLPTRARATSHDQIKTFLLAAAPNFSRKACGTGTKKSMLPSHKVTWEFPVDMNAWSRRCRLLLRK
jgi:hypothetical protein